EDPRELDPPIRVVRGLFVEREQEQRIEPTSAVRGIHPEQQQPSLRDVPLSKEHPNQAQGKQAPISPFERLIDVRNRDGARTDPAVDFGENGSALVENRLQLGCEPSEFGLGWRNEPPVALPRAAVDDPKALHLTRELCQIQRANDEPFTVLKPLC